MGDQCKRSGKQKGQRQARSPAGPLTNCQARGVLCCGAVAAAGWHAARPSETGGGAAGVVRAVATTRAVRFDYREWPDAVLAVSAMDIKITAPTSVITARATGVRKPASCQPKSPCP